MGQHTPTSLTQALEMLADTGARVIAGGTDVFPAQGDAPPPSQLLDVTRLPELRGISHDANGWRIGATTRWSDIVQSGLPPGFDGLKLAAREVGSWQIQNAGTVAGNLCNASPAADGVPPLLTLDAQVELCSASGSRRLSLADFITGPRQTALRPDELLVALHIPAIPDAARSHFLKLGARRYLVISIAMVSALVSADDAGRIQAARVAVGACSAVAQRLPGLEEALIGLDLADLQQSPASLWSGHLDPLSPISDVRGTGEYRLQVAATLCHRSVLACLEAQHG